MHEDDVYNLCDNLLTEPPVQSANDARSLSNNLFHNLLT